MNTGKRKLQKYCHVVRIRETHQANMYNEGRGTGVVHWVLLHKLRKIWYQRVWSNWVYGYTR